METIKKEETYKYKDRLFKIKVTEEEDGFHVRATDEVTKKQVDRGKCSHENYIEIRKRKISGDPVGEIIEVIKKTINLWVDKGLI